MDFTNLVQLALEMKKLSPQWGSEEQVDAENAFFKEAKSVAAKLGVAEKFEGFCASLNKATDDEMIVFTMDFFLTNALTSKMFEAFQSTRQKHKDNEPYHPDERIMEGHTYLDTFKEWVGEALHIEINNGESDWKYSLTIMNQSWASDNLEELEHHLFTFAMREGYCDDLKELSAT